VNSRARAPRGSENLCSRLRRGWEEGKGIPPPEGSTTAEEEEEAEVPLKQQKMPDSRAPLMLEGWGEEEEALTACLMA
jgi:hypothetical protein